MVLDGLASFALSRVSFGKPLHSTEASSAAEREPEDRADLIGLAEADAAAAIDDDEARSPKPRCCLERSHPRRTRLL